MAPTRVFQVIKVEEQAGQAVYLEEAASSSSMAYKRAFEDVKVEEQIDENSGPRKQQKRARFEFVSSLTCLSL